VTEAERVSHFRERFATVRQANTKGTMGIEKVTKALNKNKIPVFQNFVTFSVPL